jgi:uncharacterized membrane protein
VDKLQQRSTAIPTASVYHTPPARGESNGTTRKTSLQKIHRIPVDSDYIEFTAVKLIAPILKSALVYLVLCVATFLMLRMVLDYTALRDDVDFLRFKQAYVGYWWWKTSFYVHVFSAIGALLAGFTQFSSQILRQHRSIHRLMGRFYAYDILAINFPTGMVLAVCANGLLPGRIAFVLLDCLWFTFTLVAVVAIRRGQIARHRQFMVRSYALTFSAITLRSWKLILSHGFHIEPLQLYMLEAWMGFVPNLLVAEWWLRTRHQPRLESSMPKSPREIGDSIVSDHEVKVRGTHASQAAPAKISPLTVNAETDTRSDICTQGCKSRRKWR